MPIPGFHRSDIPYAWPTRFYRPSYDKKLVYLDLNHWIYLAQANTGHRQGRPHRDALEVLRRAAASERFLFVLSGTHHMEIEGVTSPRQRGDLADVMEELTQFRTLLSRASIIRLEVEAALDDLVGPLPQPLYLPVTLIGSGVFHAFGLRGGLRVYDSEGNDVTEEARLQWPEGPDAFDRWRAENELRLERSVLRGPTDAEAPELRALGWRPEAIRQIAIDRARTEQDLSTRLSAIEQGRWRRGRIRDVVAGRYLFFELNELVGQGMQARRRQLDEVFDGLDVARRFTDSMPSADIAITLITAHHRNPQMRWTPNDIYDIDAMSIAVPYCDIVVTERHACQTLSSAHADARAATTILARLDELAEVIEAELAQRTL